MIEETEFLAPGHRMCAGCGVALSARIAVNTAGKDTIVVSPTGCMEVTTTQYPETAWRVPFLHVAFENAASAASGIDSALKMLGKRENKNILVFAGDGGTFDIGLQALSGMFERGHKVTFICNDNEAYMNTGIQRCSATPYGAWTTTSPPGKYSIGESKPKKPIARIAAAHCIPYVATATIAYVADYQKKLKKALAVDGPSFIHVLAPCPSGWRFASDELIEVSRLAVQTGVFVLWEVENGEMENLKITKKIPQRKPVEEYLKTQGRFKHLFKPVLRKDVIGQIQAEIDKKFERFGL
ncbi:MAG TPA: pyruvate synthase subunit beta [Thermoplasmata archaeon]|nr:pyruvate synthase subunit beta [Thermoplasmata archaeon]HIH98114.1 pyruvate synthase subunit beta [Thermoplasmata archaeon]